LISLIVSVITLYGAVGAAVLEFCRINREKPGDW